jgi:sugar phosphate isomerase/epimerase
MVNEKDYNCDYIELSAQSIYAMSEEEFSALKKRVIAGELRPYAVNGLVPGNIRLTGPDVNYDTVKEYADKCFGRLSELDIKTLVFGSSAAKIVPEGFSMEKAWEQLFEVGRIFSDVAAKYGQRIAVEGLRRAECNIVNTLEDVYYYVKNVNRDNFLMLADFYHMYENGEDISDIKKYKDYLIHCHIAGCKERAVPTDEEEPFINECIKALKEMDYEGGVSFEGFCDTDDVKSIPDMFTLFKRCAE